jgi:predicted GNAT family acetyltransferase
MTGELGPWAMCTIDGAPASLCHCSRIADAGVAAGLWTHPDYRRHGYGAAATAAWAAIALQEWQHVFYSTNAGNRSSERVAERLGLRPIGWRWMLSPAISS